jgi:hypothetical protein
MMMMIFLSGSLGGQRKKQKCGLARMSDSLARDKSSPSPSPSTCQVSGPFLAFRATQFERYYCGLDTSGGERQHIVFPDCTQT